MKSLGFFDWFLNGSVTKKGTLEVCNFDIPVELFYKKLAIDSSVNLIANAMVKSRFRTLEKGKIKKGEVHYLFNVKPNKNQNASEFIHKFTSNLLYENEVLAVMQGNELYIADSWERAEFAIKENIYSKVKIGDFTFDKAFNESEVFYFKLNNENITKVIDGLYGSYARLLSASMSQFKKRNSKKFFVRISAAFSQAEDDQEDLSELLSEQFKSFFNSEGDALWPLQEGLELEEADKNPAKDNLTSRDIRAIIDDIFDFVAMAFHIPKGLLKGDVADVGGMTDNFLTFCINPIAELLADEINSKMYNKKEYLEGTRLVVDTRLIKTMDISTMANAVDKFLLSGTHSIDENRDMMGEEPLNEDFSTKHYVTKNYASSEEVMRGGE